MDDILKLWFAAKIIVNFIAIFIFYLYWKYLENKPLGMQTVLDLMAKDFMCLNTIAFFTSSLVYIKFHENYSAEVAMIIIRINYMTGGIAILLMLMAAIVIRYLYICYPGLMYETNDQNIMLVTRCFVGVGSITCAFLEEFTKAGPEYIYLTGSNNEEENEVGTLKILQGILAIDFILLFLLQVKIEFHKEKLRKNSTINFQRGRGSARRQQQRQKNSIFGNSTLAITFVLLMVMIFIVFEWTFFPRTVGSNMVAKALRTRVISNIILSVILPILWIRKIKNFSMFVYVYFYDFEPLPGPNLQKLKRVAPQPKLEEDLALP